MADPTTGPMTKWDYLAGQGVRKRGRLAFFSPGTPINPRSKVARRWVYIRAALLKEFRAAHERDPTVTEDQLIDAAATALLTVEVSCKSIIADLDENADSKRYDLSRLMGETRAMSAEVRQIRRNLGLVTTLVELDTGPADEEWLAQQREAGLV